MRGLILVAPAGRSGALRAEHAPSHVLALASPPGLPGEAAGPAVLTLAFHDIAEARDGLRAPERPDVAAILAFARSWDGRRPFLVHCTMGISRSTAAALIVACDRRPEAAEIDVARRLRAAAPCATPNPRMIALADEALGRSGRLVAAVAAIGRGAAYVPQAGFALALDDG